MNRPIGGEAARMLAIATASAEVAMHPQTLRKYERAGLVRPARRESGSRHYSAADLERLQLLKHLADVRRINIAGMILALELYDEMAGLLECVRAMEGQPATQIVQERIGRMLGLFGIG